ncbi:helix-turn-helix transcriptional regulator [Enterococcus faecalis]|nr:helix-turn-helix transcriptional regulator [Enterococcus faecalis]EKK0978280.1 helix-turn-helix transcriptional regulator [Enterococcus faecalis]EKZ0164240.1 helix-turn-helix transcriptional regulator [Enterococcus faecalis]EKZ0220917.1 helix-turn-helix transcriptional regulator [Enterococcus faecalis]
MIRVNLNYYIEKYNLNISQLSKETGISRKALTLLANYNDSEEPPVSIQYNTIETLCKYFKIGVDSLIEYEYSQEDFEILPVAYNLGKNKDICLFLYVYQIIINNEEKIFFFPVTTKIKEKIEEEKIKIDMPSSLFANSNEIKSETNYYTKPALLSFNFEVILDKYFNKVEKLINNTPYVDLFSKNNVHKLSDEEIASLLKSFNKSFLAQFTARMFNYLIEENQTDTQLIVDWNFGYYSFMHSSDFHLEYAKKGNQILSLDDDNLIDPLEDITTNSNDIEKRSYPNSNEL